MTGAAARDRRVDQPEAVEERAGAEPRRDHRTPHREQTRRSPSPVEASTADGRAVQPASRGGDGVGQVMPRPRQDVRAAPTVADQSAQRRPALARPPRAAARAARRRRASGAAPRPARPGRRAARAARAAPPSPRPERLGHAADVGGDDRQPAGQRLGDDHAVRLGPRGQHQQVGRGVGTRPARRRTQRPGEAHPVGEPGWSSTRRPQLVDEGRVAVRLPDAERSATAGRRPSPAPPAARRAPCRGSPPPRRAARPPVGRARREAAGSDARARRRGPRPGRGRSASSSQPPGPAARRDDRRGGGQHRALPGTDVCAASGGLAERHVHEDDQAQPARLGHAARPGRPRRSGRRPARTRRPGCRPSTAPDARARARVGPRPGPGPGARATVQPSAASPAQTRRS